MIGRKVVLPSGQRLNLRLAQPAHAAAHRDFLRGLSAPERQSRYFAPFRELSPAALARTVHSSRACCGRSRVPSSTEKLS